MPITRPADAPAKVIVVGYPPDLDQLAVELNTLLTGRPAAVLLHIPDDPASEAARSMCSGDGWSVEPSGLSSIPIVASLALPDVAPDLLLVCLPSMRRHPLANNLRLTGRDMGITVRDVPMARTGGASR